MDWQELVSKAETTFTERKLSGEYRKRLDDELYEIVKQGANGYWLEQNENKKTWDKNPNGLVLPWLLGMTPVDPIEGKISHLWVYQTDFPDIDSDFEPDAREIVKEHAAKAYKYVCSVGNWVTYKPKSAIQDVTRALGGDLRAAMLLTTALPDEFDDETLEKLNGYVTKAKSSDPKESAEARQELGRYAAFYDYKQANPEVVDIAFRLVGKIKTQSTHAGGLIIADRPIEELVPMSLIKSKKVSNWTSQWTEGRKTQLSKFGLVKFDILGVKTIQYIHQASDLIKSQRGIIIKWDTMDPVADPPIAGREILPDGTERPILFNDPVSLQQCNEQKTDSVFQIETPIQKNMIAKGKVKTFWDLIAYNALGRPGPMDMIPDYIDGRDGKIDWKKGVYERIIEILKETFGVICYQEQLQAIWMQLAGFTLPEAEVARKIISKKWVEKLPIIEAQWKKGATKVLGEEETNRWWEKMVAFGRYCFNKSHACAYSIVTYRCLYLKAHYPSEWWAAVMSTCQPKKLPHYLSAARQDGVEFGSLDANNLSHAFSVRDGKVIPGLMSVKGIGKAASLKFTSIPGPFKDIDEMVDKFGKTVKVYERLIKLGAFDNMYPNRQGLWAWYQYKYCSGPKITKLKEALISYYWPEERIQAQRQDFIKDFQREFPKRKKIPKKWSEWTPKKEKFDIKQVMDIIDDYRPRDKFAMEKTLLGYYWSSPLSLYINEGHTIETAKRDGVLEAVVEGVQSKTAQKTGNIYYVLLVTDGVQNTQVTVWYNIYQATDKRMLQPGIGIRMNVDFNKERGNFKISNNTAITALIPVDSEQAVSFTNASLHPEASQEFEIW